METLKDFSKIKILIVGDVMIDRYWWGSSERISPEAPVPVVRLNNTSMVAGGAANVAANVVGLGAQPYLVGITGDDAEAKAFPELLAASGINPEFLLKVKNRPTTVKTRVIAHSQQVARIDHESNSAINENDEERLWRKIKNLVKKTDAVILSDYAKGLLTENLLSLLIAAAKAENKLILVDPKGKNFLKYKNADVITPNQREVSDACGLAFDAGAEETERAGGKLISTLNLKALLVTRGENGMMLLEKRKKTLYLKAAARKVYDVTGAGDTVIAALAVALCANMNLAESARLANAAAGIVVEQVGTTALKIETLKQHLNAVKEID